jgi:hypothetical protein
MLVMARVLKGMKEVELEFDLGGNVVASIKIPITQAEALGKSLVALTRAARGEVKKEAVRWATATQMPKTTT